MAEKKNEKNKEVRKLLLKKRKIKKLPYIVWKKYEEKKDEGVRYLFLSRDGVIDRMDKNFDNGGAPTLSFQTLLYIFIHFNHWK